MAISLDQRGKIGKHFLIHLVVLTSLKTRQIPLGLHRIISKTKTNYLLRKQGETLKSPIQSNTLSLVLGETILELLDASFGNTSVFRQLSCFKRPLSCINIMLCMDHPGLCWHLRRTYPESFWTSEFLILVMRWIVPHEHTT